MQLRILCAPLLLTGCAASGSPEVGRSALIVDAVHDGGHEGVYFLPPLAPAAPLPPAFDDSLALTALLEDASGAPLVEAPLFVTDEHYHGFVDTDGLALDPGAVLRLSLRSGRRELAFADVQIFASERAARAAASDEIFELVDGKKLLVKVYVNRCGAAEIAAATACRAAASCDPLDGSVTFGAAAPDGTACPTGRCVGGECCTPKSCADVFTCGLVADGCGGTLDCCTTGQACGADAPCATSWYGSSFPPAQVPTCCDGTNACVGPPALCQFTPPSGGTNCTPTAFCMRARTHQWGCCTSLNANGRRQLGTRLCTGPGHCLNDGTYPNCISDVACPEGSTKVFNATLGFWRCRNECGEVGPGGCVGCPPAAGISNEYLTSCSLTFENGDCKARLDGVEYCMVQAPGCPYADPAFCKWTSAPCAP